MTAHKPPHIIRGVKTPCYKWVVLAMLSATLSFHATAQMAFRIDSSGNILEQSATILDHDTESISGAQWTLLEGNNIIWNGSTLSVTGLPEGVMLQRIAGESATSSFVFGDDSQAYLVDETGAVTYSTNGIQDYDTNPFNNDRWTLYTVGDVLDRNGSTVRVQGLPSGVTVERLVAWDASTVYLFANNGYSYTMDNSGTIESSTDGIFDETLGPSGTTNWTLYKTNNFIYFNRVTPVYLDDLPENTTLHRISAINANSAYVFAIPEPSSLLLAALALIAILFLRRSRNPNTRRA